MTRDTIIFAAGCVAAALFCLSLALWLDNEYPFYAGYFVMQFVVIAVAWNLTGGYARYVNFGTAGFFGAGVYTAAAIGKAFAAPLLVQLLGAAAVGALLGLFAGYLSARMRGMYFSLVTLALAVLVETVVHNTAWLGGARGLSVLAPLQPPLFPTNTRYLFFVMALLAIAAVVVTRACERSRFGKGLAAIRDDEAAAESCGIPTFRIKCTAMVLSGAMMAIAGAPFSYYAGYIEPMTAFSMNISLQALAMPLLGGTGSWAGPVLGAIILSTAQQLVSVTISAEYTLLVLGLILVFSVILLPNGLLGFLGQKRKARRARLAAKAVTA